MQKRSRTINGIWTAVLTVLSLAWIYPIVMVVINSFKVESAISTSTAFQLPTAEQFAGLDNFASAIGSQGFLAAFFNSLVISVTSVVLILICCSMCAWFITRVNSKVTKLCYFLFVFSMVVPFQMLMFTLANLADKTKLNTPFNICIVYLGFGAGLAVFMFCGFMKSIPLEIEEAAMIDGCGPIRTFFLVVLPMLFMTKPGFAQKIREYVENGGIVVATYLLGYVDESTLCWLGGFPGDGLREVFGVTASELDTLYPGEGNRAIWVKSSQQSSIKDYCELLQPAEGTEVVAVYGQDFYSGHAAVTHHVFGKGHAYYIGARLDDAGNAAVLRAALADAKVHLRDLPQGVEYHCRESENARYHFYINTTQSAVKVQVESGADLLSGKNVLGSMELKPYDACAIEEKVK